MTTPPANCQGCDSPGPHERPIYDHVLYSPGFAVPMRVSLCLQCIELDRDGSHNEKFNLWQRVQIHRALESQGRQGRAEQ